MRGVNDMNGRNNKWIDMAFLTALMVLCILVFVPDNTRADSCPHMYITGWEEVPATCSFAGTHAYRECESCHTMWAYASDIYADPPVTQEELVIPALHPASVEHVPQRAASCTVPGVREHWYCRVCDKNYTDVTCTASLTEEAMVIPAKGHKFQQASGFYNEVPATCTRNGRRAFYKCDNCKNFFAEDKVTPLPDPIIPALGHACETLIAESYATCTQDGWPAHYVCGRCSEWIAEDKETIIQAGDRSIPAKQHDLSAGPIAETAPTCLQDGVPAHYECKNCGAWLAEDAATELTGNAKRIPAKGHTFREDSYHPENPADCLNSGRKAYYQCIACKQAVAEDQVTVLTYETMRIPAKGHDCTKLIDEQPASCAQSGVYAHYVCERCKKLILSDGMTIVQEADLVIPAQHYPGDWISEVPNTCSADGEKGHFVCKVCRAWLLTDEKTVIPDSDKVIPAKHPDAVKSVKRVEPNCTDSGTQAFYECEECRRQQCSVYRYLDADCRTAATPELLLIPSTGHDLKGGVIGKVNETCTQDGTPAHYECQTCGAWLGEDGITELTGDAKKIPAAGHKYGPAGYTWSEDGRCTAVRTCSVCSAATEGHEERETAAGTYVTDTEATCTACKTGHYEASFRNAAFAGQRTVTKEYGKPNGHTYIDHTAQAPTCTAIGWNAYRTCEECDYTTYEELPALDHDPEDVPGQSATFTQTGLTKGVRCSRCGAWMVEQRVIPRLRITEADLLVLIDGVPAPVQPEITVDRETGAMAVLREDTGEGTELAVILQGDRLMQLLRELDTDRLTLLDRDGRILLTLGEGLIDIPAGATREVRISFMKEEASDSADTQPLLVNGDRAEFISITAGDAASGGKELVLWLPAAFPGDAQVQLILSEETLAAGDMAGADRLTVSDAEGGALLTITENASELRMGRVSAIALLYTE